MICQNYTCVFYNLLTIFISGPEPYASLTNQLPTCRLHGLSDLQQGCQLTAGLCCLCQISLGQLKEWTHTYIAFRILHKLGIHVLKYPPPIIYTPHTHASFLYKCINDLVCILGLCHYYRSLSNY